MELKDLTKLAKIASTAKPSTTYSFEGENFTASEINETLRSELKAIAGNYHLYEQNKHTIFALVENVIDDIICVSFRESIPCCAVRYVLFREGILFILRRYFI